MHQYKKLIIACSSLIAILVIGTTGFYLIEGYSFLDAFSVTVGLLTTTSIGYGKYVPVSVYGKIFSLLLIIFGVSLVAYAFGNVVSLVLDGHLSNLMGRSKMNKKIANLQDHIILCGAGRVGQHVISRLVKEGEPFLVIDRNEEITKRLIDEGILTMVNDATKDEVLLTAGIKKARGLIAALPSDADNVFVTLTAKELNPNIRIVARGEIAESKPKLLRAGADKIVSPSVIGGRRMAISILKPVSVDFVETLIHKEDVEFELEEIITSGTSVLVGKALKDSMIKQSTGTMIVAIKRNDEIISNPSAEEVILDGDLLIAIGTRPQLAQLEQIASNGVK